MKFYEIDDALSEGIEAGDKRLRLKLEYDLDGVTTTVNENDVLEADFFTLKEVAGGVASRGEVFLDNSSGAYSVDTPHNGVGAEVRVYFSVGFGLSWFHRFTFFVNDCGFQNVRGAGCKRRVRLVLRDRAELLRRSDERKDWTEAAAFTYVRVCDKTKPDNSLLHLIAKRAGLQTNDIDCCMIPLTLPYIKLSKNIWEELSALALAYRCHLETATEKPLVFAHSPYQEERLHSDDISYTFKGTDIFYFRITALPGH
jgi:hypothetical protein